MDLSFSRLWDGFATDKDALKARNAKLREMRKAGENVKGWTLSNQLKKYDGFGQPNGGTCNVYYITVI